MDFALLAFAKKEPKVLARPRLEIGILGRLLGKSKEMDGLGAGSLEYKITQRLLPDAFA